MSDVTQEQELTPEIRRRAIEDKVLLLSPTVSRWEGRLKIPKERIKLEIDGKEVNTSKKGLTTPHTVMITDSWPVDVHGMPWKKRIAKILVIKDRIISKYSIPFQLAGARIVPKHKGLDFFSEMIGLTLGKLRRDLAEATDEHRITQLEDRIAIALRNDPNAVDSTPVYDPLKSEDNQSFAYQWNKLADEFCRDLLDRVRSDDYESEYRGSARYPADIHMETGEVLTDEEGKEIRRKIRYEHGILTQIKSALDRNAPGVWPLVQHRVPKTFQDMRSKFKSSVYPVELASGTQFEGVTESLLSEYSDVVNQAMEEAVESCIEHVIERPREELSKAIGNLRDLINRDGQVSSKSFKPVYAAIEKLRLFKFACSDEMIEALNDLDDRMSRTNPSSLDSRTAANNGFADVLDEIILNVENSVQAERDIQEFGRELRGITL
jgi:hypothetical protein